MNYSNDKGSISSKLLDSLGIYELRELARSIGVVSPTTKKREELCREIIKISSGEIKVNQPITKKGRPPKTITKISNIVKDYIPDEILKLQKPVENESYSNFLMLAQNPTILCSDDIKNNKQVLGYLNSVHGHFYLNNIKNSEFFKFTTFYVPNEIIEEFSLREGDKIIAFAKVSENYNCGVVEELIKINDIEVKNWENNRKNLDISTYEMPTISTSIFNKPIKKGERTISFFKNDEEAILNIIDEIQNFSNLNNFNEKLVFVGIEVAPEVIYYGKTKKNLEMFATSYYNDLEDSYNAVINAINYCNTTLKDGNSIRIFIFDIVGLLTRLDQYFAHENNFYLGHSVSGVQLVKKLVGLGKAISKDLTITTHSIAFDNQKNCDFIVNEVEKIAKNV